MAILIDTNVLVRLANNADPDQPVVTKAIAALHRRGESLFIAPQNIVEFRAVATRPVLVNGLGRSSAEVKIKIVEYLATFLLLEETPAIFPEWLAIVEGLGVLGKQVHDARLAACCYVHRLGQVLTFNVSHFSRLPAFRPGLAVLDPTTVCFRLPSQIGRMGDSVNDSGIRAME